MKKTLLVGALTSVFATMAHAQSSVTLYGLIDAGITYVNNAQGHSLWQMSSGAINSSRWGLRGSEDLGGGLKAIFTLENGFSIANGTLAQQSREFGRQAFVGLSSTEFGTVTLGRQYDDVVQYLGPLALTGTAYGGTFFAHPLDNDNLDNTFRVNNSVHYQSANYAGFKLGAMYGFSNAAGGFANNREYSVGASYSFGGFNFAAAYLQLNNSLNSTTSTGAVTDTPFTAKRQRIWGAGLNYTFGPATAGFVFTQTRLDGATSVFGAGPSATVPNLALVPASSLRFNNFEVNGRYALTPTLSVSGQYTYTDGELNNDHPHWHTVGLLANYYLSKRTDVYLQGEYQHADNDGTPFTAFINGLKPSSTSNQVAVTAGIRHRF